MADEGLTAGAVARRLGVAVTTLRTWHQRYGLGPSEHVPGQHRRYTEQDLSRLEVMRRLTARGVTAAEAAAWARRTPGSPATSSDPSEGAASSGSSGSGQIALGAAPSGSSASAQTIEPGTAPSGSSASAPMIGVGAASSGGGQIIALGATTPAARGLARAAMRLDAPSMRDLLDAAVADHGVIAAWDTVIAPVLIGIGERHQATQRFVEVEHLLSRSVTEVLGAIPRPRGTDPPKALLAAADEEQHTLPLEALAAALAQAGVPTRLFGARVPRRALGDAIARTGPAVVVLWSQMQETGDPDQLLRVTTAPHPPLLVAAGGPGWPADLPPAVARLTNLAEAVQAVRAAT